MSGLPWLWFQPKDGGRWHMVGDTRRVDPSPVEIHGRYRYEMRGDCSRSDEWVERPAQERIATACDVDPDECCSLCKARLDRMVDNLIETRDDLYRAPASRGVDDQREKR